MSNPERKTRIGKTIELTDPSSGRRIVAEGGGAVGVRFEDEGKCVFFVGPDEVDEVLALFEAVRRNLSPTTPPHLGRLKNRAAAPSDPNLYSAPE